MSRLEISTLYFELANQTADSRHKAYLLELGRQHQEVIDAVDGRTQEMAIRARIAKASADKEPRS